MVKSLYGPNISYLAKPFDLAQLKLLLAKTAAAGIDPEDDENPSAHYGCLVGESDIMQRLYQVIERVGGTDANVLLQGESGVGKELVARAIHACGNPASPFVAANCGAFSKELLGSELFGHEKGAFTGAVSRKIGLFERASGGTLFLDEITEMALEQQPLLLRALETKTITRVGGTEEIAVDCRVISATNRSVESLVEDKCLREDLYFRLAVFPIVIPALRERGDDVKLLAVHFLQELNSENNSQLELNEEQLAQLAEYDWPGNVRELRHAMHRAYLLSNRAAGQVELPSQLASPFSRTAVAGLSQQLVGKTIDEVERKLIEMTLEHCDGNRTQTAEVLGISLKTLYNRINQYSEEAH
jgi:DNA-binding NtrC family response regulator